MIWTVGQIMVVGSAAVAGAAFLEFSDWNAIRTECMTLLAIVGGSVLFRLGRGVPSIAVEHMKPEDVQRLGRALEAVTRRLAVIAGVIACALLGLTVIGPMYEILEGRLWAVDAADALVAGLMAFVACRIVILVLGDLSLVKVQAECLTESARHAQRSRAEVEIRVLDEAGRASPHKQSSNYGGLLENS